MPSQATITGKTGPNLTVTTMILTNLVTFNLDLGKKVLTTQSDKGFIEFDLALPTTLTCTISSGNATIVVS